MIKAIIVDDDSMSRKALDMLLKKHCKNVEVIAEAESVQSALETVSANPTDVVFLDIEMPDGDGFKFLESLPEIKFEIIFTTSHNDYAIKAFKYAAIDYLTKPVKGKDLKAAVERLEQKMKLSLDNSKFQVLLDNLNGPKNSGDKKIALPTSDGLMFVKIKNIIHFEASEHYTYIYLKNKQRILVSRILKEFEEMLSDFNFFRVHHTYIVNLDYVDTYVRVGGDHVVMHNGTEIPVSRRKKEAFVQKLNEM